MVILKNISTVFVHTMKKSTRALSKPQFWHLCIYKTLRMAQVMTIYPGAQHHQHFKEIFLVSGLQQLTL